MHTEFCSSLEQSDMRFAHKVLRILTDPREESIRYVEGRPDEVAEFSSWLTACNGENPRVTLISGSKALEEQAQALEGKILFIEGAIGLTRDLGKITEAAGNGATVIFLFHDPWHREVVLDYFDG